MLPAAKPTLFAVKDRNVSKPDAHSEHPAVAVFDHIGLNTVNSAADLHTSLLPRNPLTLIT